jgi:hypothetical protein
MKKWLIYIILLFPLIVNGQSVKESFAGYAKVGSIITTTTDTTLVMTSFYGNQRSYDRFWSYTDIIPGDIVWAANCSRFVVKSRSGATLKLSNPDKLTGSILPVLNSSIGLTREQLVNGYAIAAMPQFGDGTGSGAITGISNAFAGCMLSHYNKQIIAAIGAATGETDLIDVVFKSTEQTIVGKKTFIDTVIATGGVKTTGSSSKAALIRNGVESTKDTLVTSNYQMNGNHGTVTYNTITDLQALLPPYNINTLDWIIVVRKIGDSTKKLIIRDSNNLIIFEFSQQLSITLKNINGLWKKISVQIYQN